MNVYDFDDTIYDGESAVDFFFAYMRVRPAMICYIPKVMSGLAKYKLGKISNEQMLADYAPLVKKFHCVYDKWEEFKV